jgi:hypothetical protein
LRLLLCSGQQFLQVLRDQLKVLKVRQVLMPLLMLAQKLLV